MVVDLKGYRSKISLSSNTSYNNVQLMNFKLGIVSPATNLYNVRWCLICAVIFCLHMILM